MRVYWPIIAFLCFSSGALGGEKNGLLLDLPRKAPAGQNLVIDATLSESARVERVRLRYRVGEEEDYKRVDFFRHGDGSLRAIIPASDILFPGIYYYVVWQQKACAPEFVIGSFDLPSFLPVAKPNADDWAITPKFHNSTKSKDSPAKRHFRNAKLSNQLTYYGNSAVDEISLFSAEDEENRLKGRFLNLCASSENSFVVCREQIEQSGARDLLDILNMMPAVRVSLDILGFYHLAVRGLRRDGRVSLIVDGQPMLDPYFGKNYYRIPADLIESVELFIGASNFENVSPGFLATIKLTLRRKDGFAMHVSGGAFNTMTTGLSLGTTSKLARGFFSGHVSASAGPTFFIARDRFHVEPRFGHGANIKTNANINLVGFQAYGDTFLSKARQARVFAQGAFFAHERGPYIGVFDAACPDSSLSWLLWQGRLGLKQPIGKSFFEISLFSSQNIREGQYQLTPGVSFGQDFLGDDQSDFQDGVIASLNYKTLTLGGQLKSRFELTRDLAFKIGGVADIKGLLRKSFFFQMDQSADGNYQEPRDLFGVSFPQKNPCNAYGIAMDMFGACRARLVLFISGELGLSQNIKLLAGARFLSFSDLEFQLSTHLLPRLSVSFELSRSWFFQLSYAERVSLPTFAEKYDMTPRAMVDISPGRFIGNPSLLPELMRTIEARAKYENAAGRFAQTNMQASVFFSFVENTIDKIDYNGYLNVFKNNNGYHLLGAELFAEIYFTLKTRLFFDLSWFRAQFLGIDKQEVPGCNTSIFASFFKGNNCGLISNIPQLKANVGINAEISNIGSVFATFAFGSARTNNDRSTMERRRQFKIPPFAIFNLTFSTKPLLKYLVFQVSVFNLFDFDHKDDLPRPDHMPGLVPREGAALYLGVTIDV